jgi:curli biogenesis system outer membrane secretion channel CsgG
MDTMKRIFSSNLVRLIIGFVIISLLQGCVESRPQGPIAPPQPINMAPEVNWNLLPPSSGNRDLVAVAGFENRSTYSADRLWDTSSQFLSAHLLRTGYFRVVEWEEMKRLFDWDTLSQVDIVKSPDNMRRAQRILLCEHFISGAITRFNVSTHAQASAVSKSKIIDTTVRVDLLLQNAQTGEYMATGKGEHTIRQIYTTGQVGTWNSSVGDDVLEMAIEKALFELISTYSRSAQKAPPRSGQAVQDNSGVFLKQ